MKKTKLLTSITFAFALIIGLTNTNISAANTEIISSNSNYPKIITTYTNCTGTTSNTCTGIISKIEYADASGKYVANEYKYDDEKITEKENFYRNSMQQITEYRKYTYQSNGKIKQLVKYHGAKKFDKDKVRYKNISTWNYNVNGKVTSSTVKENSLIWNGQAKEVVKQANSYLYYGNGNLKRKNTTYKSLKYNVKTKYTVSEYRSNNKALKYTATNYRSNGKVSYKSINSYNSAGVLHNRKELSYRTNNKKSKYIIKNYRAKRLVNKTVYQYNSRGQLKTNKYGKATKYVAKYKNGKRISAKKYTYK